MENNYAEISHPTGALTGKVAVPASKSISNRLLIINYLSANRVTVRNLSASGDTITLQRLLQVIQKERGQKREVLLDVANAGTVIRFLTALLAITPGRWLLTGDDRMKQRPLKELVSALRQIGASIRYTEEEGFPPVLIEGKKLQGGKAVGSADISSQYLSALLMIAPVLPYGIRLQVEGEIASLSYLYMTLRLLAMCGIASSWDGNIISVTGQPFRTREITTEPDWSSAGYWFAMAALARTADLEISGLTPSSLQGDAIVRNIFGNFGVASVVTPAGMKLTKKPVEANRFDLDFSPFPDLAQTVGVAMAAMNVPATLSGLDTLRYKETDRISALAGQLVHSGFHVSQKPDNSLVITPLADNGFSGLSSHIPNIRTYNDHRMAMSFASLALLCKKVRIENPATVEKSYPKFWKELAKAGFRVEWG